MLEGFVQDAKKYNETLNSVMNKAEENSKCNELLKAKNRLFEGNRETEDVLLKLDEILSDYYKETLKIMYDEVFRQIIRSFYSV